MVKVKSNSNSNSSANSNSRSKFDLMHLCTPATIYFIISIVGLVILGASNLGNEDRLCIGSYSCNVGSNTVIFVLNCIFILFWTFILDLMCKNGYSGLSWFILLLPFILTFIFLAMIFAQAK